MKQERGREYRIRQINRRKQLARKQFQENEWRISAKAIGIYANTPKRCSCEFCSNPRTRDCLTIQERKQKEVPIELVSENQILAEIEQLE